MSSYLPLFSAFSTKPTQDRLEARVSRLMDSADRLLLAGRVTQAEYDDWARALDRWASSAGAR